MTSKYATTSTITLNSGKKLTYYSLPKLKQHGLNINKLPISLRIILESLLRNHDELKITDTHIQQLASWAPIGTRTQEIPFVVSRIILQDLTGVPLLCDIAAMRNVAHNMGHDPKIIEPLVPVDLVVDHSVQVDYYGSNDALDKNMQIEYQRNNERYQFLKWGMQAFETFNVIPPGVGIVHQINLEYLFRGVHQQADVIYPDTLVGTDSHTTMINGVGVVGWGVGGIEAEAGMLGQPIYFLTPDVVGVELTNQLLEGVTATDLVLRITQMLRAQKVVGKFIEFFGSGVEHLSVTDRATIANMAPEYGATMGFFPIDQVTVKYMQITGKTAEEIEIFEKYFQAQELFGTPKSGDINYSIQLTLDLTTIKPALAGPKRPQDLILLENMRSNFTHGFSQSITNDGFNKPVAELTQVYPTASNQISIKNGDVLIAAITSCTNTSNPSVLIAAGLLAKKAVELGLTINKKVKTSLAPGSRVVTEYLTQAGLLPYLEQLGFNIVGYGCTTCIGNSGDLSPEINEALSKYNLIGAAVLSSNRNFEARIHPSIKANYLASPPLVIAFAIAGTVNIDLTTEPTGIGHNNTVVFLKDIWPTSHEISQLLALAQNPLVYRKLYSNLTHGLDLWNNIKSVTGNVYAWPTSTYIAQPPFFNNFNMNCIPLSNITAAKVLLMVGDSCTTDHISPAGRFKDSSPAGKYLLEHDVAIEDFNSYGARRGHHDIMVRGTFANVRIKNLLLPLNTDGTRIEGGYTLYNNKLVDVYTAAMNYQQNKIPTIIFAGEEYGTGSSRDWAAKGTLLLGVKAVIAKSYERIHRSNLIGMGVLPLQFKNNDTVTSCNITGQETFDILGVTDKLLPQQNLQLVIHRDNGTTQTIELVCRIDTPIEVEYYKDGGILNFVLRNLLKQDQRKKS